MTPYIRMMILDPAAGQACWHGVYAERARDWLRRAADCRIKGIDPSLCLRYARDNGKLARLEYEGAMRSIKQRRARGAAS